MRYRYESSNWKTRSSLLSRVGMSRFRMRQTTKDCGTAVCRADFSQLTLLVITSAGLSCDGNSTHLLRCRNCSTS